MNQVIKTINQRRSVRFFNDLELTREELETIISAGNMAPTGSSQSWRFVVVTNKEVLQKMSGLAEPKYREWIKNAPKPFQDVRAQIDAVVTDPVYYSAPAVIFVIGNSGVSENDCPMVCENIMLAARSMDIGSCWVYFGQLILDEPEIAQLLKLKKDEKVFGSIVLGRPKGDFPGSMPKKEPEILWL